jgi:hypothetical protein
LFSLGLLRTVGKSNGPYEADFPFGMRVQIADRQVLEQFRRDWHLHHPLDEQQLAFAGRVSTVARLGYYHGGDELYWFDDIPGTWHECCLRALKDGTRET